MHWENFRWHRNLLNHFQNLHLNLRFDSKFPIDTFVKKSDFLTENYPSMKLVVKYQKNYRKKQEKK